MQAPLRARANVVLTHQVAQRLSMSKQHSKKQGQCVPAECVLIIGPPRAPAQLQRHGSATAWHVTPVVMLASKSTRGEGHSYRARYHREVSLGENWLHKACKRLIGSRFDGFEAEASNRSGSICTYRPQLPRGAPSQLPPQDAPPCIFRSIVRLCTGAQSRCQRQGLPLHNARCKHTSAAGTAGNICCARISDNRF